MTLNDLYCLLPYIWLGFGGLFVLLLGLLPAGKYIAFQGALVVLSGTIISSSLLLNQTAVVDNFILINRFTQSCIIFFSIIAVAVLLMSRASSLIARELDETFYSLIIFSVLGMALLPGNNLIAMFIGIEMITVCGFALVIWSPSRYGAVEAAAKFVIAAGLAAGALVMGIALIYLGSGTVMLSEIQSGLASSGGNSVITVIGIFMLMTGIGFELAIVPFHSWLADVYEGAPASIVAFLGSITKLAVLAWLVLFPLWLNELWAEIEPVMAVLAILSMVVGTLSALRQTSLKRILAYSSVAHFGFILVPLAVYQPEAVSAVIYYGIGYAVATVGALAIIIGCEKTEGLSELECYRGVGRRYPFVGVALGIVILSLAGIPPLTGFFAKLIIFQTAINHGAYLLAIVLALTSAAGLYYYIRILLVVFDKVPDAEILNTQGQTDSFSLLSVVSSIAVVFSLLVIILGIAAQPVINYAATIL